MAYQKLSEDDFIYIKMQNPDFLQLAKDKKTYVCPVCGSGSGKNGTGMVMARKNDTNKTPYYKCYACGLTGDIIDIYAVANHMQKNSPELYHSVYQYFIKKENISQNKITETVKGINSEMEVNRVQIDFTAFYERAEKNNDYKYLLKRGISVEIQKKFHVGLDKYWKNPKLIQKYEDKNKIPYSPRCIIPRSKDNYLARDTRAREDFKNEQDYQKSLKYAKQTGGDFTHLFNPEAMNNRVCFVCEGEIDAMSIEEVGGHACSTNSTSNWIKILDYMIKHRYGQVLILVFDNDSSGMKALDSLKKELDNEGILHLDYIMEDNIKDMNEFLLKDREKLQETVAELEQKALSISERCSIKEDASSLIGYFNKLEIISDYTETETGFLQLDKHDDFSKGFLKEGLYLLGGNPSVGKTAFILQIAEYIAKNGKDILYFTYDDTCKELVARGLSRRTYEAVMKKNESLDFAKSTNDFLNPSLREHLSKKEEGLMTYVMECYTKENRNHLYIYENKMEEPLTFEKFLSILERHQKIKNATPIIFIDNLDGLGYESNTGYDKTAYQLKKIAKSYHTTVMATCNYNRFRQMEGALPNQLEMKLAYIADVLLVLQKNSIQNDKCDVKVSLSCLKNKHGNGFISNYDYNIKYHYFGENNII